MQQLMEVHFAETIKTALTDLKQFADVRVDITEDDYSLYKHSQEQREADSSILCHSFVLVVFSNYMKKALEFKQNNNINYKNIKTICCTEGANAETEDCPAVVAKLATVSVVVRPGQADLVKQAISVFYDSSVLDSLDLIQLVELAEVADLLLVDSLLDQIACAMRAEALQWDSSTLASNIDKLGALDCLEASPKMKDILALAWKKMSISFSPLECASDETISMFCSNVGELGMVRLLESGNPLALSEQSLLFHFNKWLRNHPSCPTDLTLRMLKTFRSSQLSVDFLSDVIGAQLKDKLVAVVPCLFANIAFCLQLSTRKGITGLDNETSPYINSNTEATRDHMTFPIKLPPLNCGFLQEVHGEYEFCPVDILHHGYMITFTPSIGKRERESEFGFRVTCQSENPNLLSRMRCLVTLREKTDVWEMNIEKLVQIATGLFTLYCRLDLAEGKTFKEFAESVKEKGIDFDLLLPYESEHMDSSAEWRKWIKQFTRYDPDAFFGPN